ncbi:MAG TPA: hypothetical protein DCR70_11245 [Phycisphaerales bacterium]|nr:hypothetical protein [Phycisphaerales bacterium]
MSVNRGGDGVQRCLQVRRSRRRPARGPPRSRIWRLPSQCSGPATPGLALGPSRSRCQGTASPLRRVATSHPRSRSNH